MGKIFNLQVNPPEFCRFFAKKPTQQKKKKGAWF